MARLSGLGSFVLIAAVVLLGLRGLHVGVPMFFPETRPGPFALTSLNEVKRHAGFSPIVPAYRPQALGERPTRLIVTRRDPPTFLIEWRGPASYLSVTQRQGGTMPAHPPAAVPMPDVRDSTWWTEGPRQHLVLKRGDFWLDIETDLPPRDLRRIADTLEPYRETPPGR
jgi:hypothetical protein